MTDFSDKSAWEQEGVRLFEATRRADAELRKTQAAEAVRKADAEFAGLVRHRSDADLLAQKSEARSTANDVLNASPEGEAKRAADAAFARWMIANGERPPDQRVTQEEFTWGTQGGRWYVVSSTSDLTSWIAKPRNRPPQAIPEGNGKWVLGPNDLARSLNQLPVGTQVTVEVALEA